MISVCRICSLRLVSLLMTFPKTFVSPDITLQPSRSPLMLRTLPWNSEGSPLSLVTLLTSQNYDDFTFVFNVVCDMIWTLALLQNVEKCWFWSTSKIRKSLILKYFIIEKKLNFEVLQKQHFKYFIIEKKFDFEVLQNCKKFWFWSTSKSNFAVNVYTWGLVNVWVLSYPIL